jgi:hypothetical protein
MTLAEIHKRQDAYYNATLNAFVEHLQDVIQHAQSATLDRLMKKLTIEKGAIAQTPGNMRTLRHLNKVFIEEMDRAGYGRLVDAFVNEFPQQLPFLHESLDAISAQMKTPLPKVDFTAKDLNVFTAVRANSVAAIQGAIESGANTAMTQALFSVGGLKFSELVTTLQAKFETTLARAETLADTAQSTFYRIALDRAFQIIEADAPEINQVYRYSGPEDSKNRPFCHKLLVADKGYSREEINQMDNGQIPNPFISAGGWNCRHQWIVDTRPMVARMQAAA